MGYIPKLLHLSLPFKTFRKYFFIYFLEFRTIINKMSELISFGFSSSSSELSESEYAETRLASPAGTRGGGGGGRDDNI